MKFSVIIPTVWQANKLMQKLISDLDSTGDIDEILIIDNRIENTPEWIYSFNKVKILRQSTGLYFNASVNLGVDRAKNELCCIINDDNLIDCDIFNFILNNIPNKVGGIFMDPNSINGKLVTDKNHEFHYSNFPNHKELIPYKTVINHGPGMFFCFFKADFTYIPEEIKHWYGDIFTFFCFRYHKLNNFLIRGFEMNVEYKGSTSSKDSGIRTIIKEDRKMYPRIMNEKYFNMTQKKYIWNFMGQTYKKGNRKNIIKSLSKIDAPYFLNVNKSWLSNDSIDIMRYKKIIEQSIFTICPKGRTNPDTFRLYEAIEGGSIPIIETDEYWNDLFGSDHPLIQFSDWDKAADEIMVLSKKNEWQNEYRLKLASWWDKQKSKIKQKINEIITTRKTYNICFCCDENLIQHAINPLLKTKQQQFIELKDQWKNFKDYNFLKYISNQLPKAEIPKNKFNTYNPNQKIAIVSLYTKEISDYAIYSEKCIKEYCEKQGYTFYIYREKLEKESNPNWSKAQALLNHIDNHEYIIWMDSDTLIFNPEKRFESIIQKAPKKFILATKDIGNNSMLNSGVLLFKSHQYTKNLIKRWRDFQGDKSSLYASGGDQEIFCQILKKSDSAGFNRKIFEMNEFNTDPRFVDNNTFILHFMSYPLQLKKIFISYWGNFK